MSTLIVVRHGRSTSNSAGTLAGRTPGIVLDETGEAQARTLGERLKGVNLHTVVCSPLERCRQTVDLALATAGLNPQVHLEPRVQESDYGQWQGRMLADLAKEPGWATVQSRPSEARFPGGESMLEVRDRVVAAVNDWNRQLPADAVWLVASHGDPISGLLTWALGMDFDRVQSLMVDPASASVVHLPDPGETRPGHDIVRVATVNSIAGPLASFCAQPQLAQSSVGGGLGAAGGGEVNKVDA